MHLTFWMLSSWLNMAPRCQHPKAALRWPQQLRSAVVPQGMAGNIIHAIATTNAIIAGLITVVAMQILAGCSDLAKARPCHRLIVG